MGEAVGRSRMEKQEGELEGVAGGRRRREEEGAKTGREKQDGGAGGRCRRERQ